jgi:nitrite reductase/ring-hydroxylating ferredoxin subunit
MERVAPESELWSGEMRGYEVRGRRVLLVKLDGEVFAYDDRCAHLGLPLSNGRLQDEVITCAAHAYQYCARTGAGINPRSVKLRACPVAIVDGFVEVELGERAQ